MISDNNACICIYIIIYNVLTVGDPKFGCGTHEAIRCQSLLMFVVLFRRWLFVLKFVHGLALLGILEDPHPGGSKSKSKRDRSRRDSRSRGSRRRRR